MGRNEVTSTWQQFWVDRRDSIAAPRGKSPIFFELEKITGGFKAKKVLEAGSGIAEISIDIAAQGGVVTLLDISKDALEMSQRFLEKRGLTATYVLGDLFDMPFKENSFDIVWNAGVVEHFKFDDQVAALKQFGRVVKSGGYVITFNPNARAKLYRWGKRVGEQRGTWEFGEEYPVESMKAMAEAAGLRLEPEYSFFFERSISFLRYASPMLRGAVKGAYVLTGGRFNPLWQKSFGGYMLASVMRKP
ncbi:MAG: methyltransferase domain-containing protein [Bacteroidota bacterium]